MYTNSNTKPSVKRMEEREHLVIGVAKGTGALYIGALVKLEPNNTVEPVASATDRPLGIIISNWEGNSEGKVRVATPFSSIIRVKAVAAVNAGDELSVTGQDTTAERNEMDASTTGDWVSAIALETVAGAAEIEVGILRVPYLKA